MLRSFIKDEGPFIFYKKRQPRFIPNNMRIHGLLFTDGHMWAVTDDAINMRERSPVAFIQEIHFHKTDICTEIEEFWRAMRKALSLGRSP